MMKKLLILTLIIAASTVVFAGSNKTGENSLAAKIETQLAGAAPNVVVISVDESTKTATLRGSVSSQTEMDRFTEAVRGVTGVRVMGTDVRVPA